jgi:hypothetical protein
MAVTMSIGFLIFMIGVAMIIVAAVGGGIEIKELKIPVLPLFPRIASFAIGCLLIAFAFTPYLSHLLSPTPVPDQTGDQKKPYLGSKISDNSITVWDVKKILNHVGYYKGLVNNEPDQTYFPAVTEFQIAQKLKADGLIGPDTYIKLREAWPDYFKTIDGAVGGRAQPARPVTSPAEAK